MPQESQGIMSTVRFKLYIQTIVLHVKAENLMKIMFPQSLSSVTSRFLLKLTGSSRRYELDLGEYGGVPCLLGAALTSSL